MIEKENVLMKVLIPYLTMAKIGIDFNQHSSCVGKHEKGRKETPQLLKNSKDVSSLQKCSKIILLKT